MNKYIFITQESASLPIADRLQDEGNEVVVGIINDTEVKENQDEKECRMSLYDNILDKQDAEQVMRWMRKLKDKDDWFLFFDYGDLWPWSERALDMGFKKGIFPTEEGYDLEKDRQKGKAMVEEHYKHISVVPASEFKNIEEGIKFIEKQKDKIYVLKSEGSNAETVVPLTEDSDLAKKQIIGALLTEKEGYEKGGYTLEEKLLDAMEITPIMIFWNGKPLFSLVEFENKPLGSGNIGRLTGGCQGITIRTDLDCKLNDIAFPDIVYEMAKKQPGIGIYDAGLLFDGKKFFFTEYCAQRWGWDGIFEEIAMCREKKYDKMVSKHFDNIAAGKSPIVKTFGASVRLFQTQPSSKKVKCYADGYTIDWTNEAANQLFFYCIKQEKDKKQTNDGEALHVSVGYQKDLGVAVGSGDSFEEAVEETYKAAEAVAMTGLYYRPKFDFLSTDYITSIVNRWEWLKDSELL